MEGLPAEEAGQVAGVLEAPFPHLQNKLMGISMFPSAVVRTRACPCGVSTDHSYFHCHTRFLGLL